MSSCPSSTVRNVLPSRLSFMASSASMRSSASSSAMRMVMDSGVSRRMPRSDTLWCGKGQHESRALPGRALRADGAAVPFDDLVADRQADTCALILRSAVQPVKRQEDALGVLAVEADAVVLDVDFGLPGRAAQGIHLHDGRLAWSVEFERVADEVLEDLTHLHGVALDPRELADRHAPTRGLNAHLEIAERVVHERRELDELRLLLLRRHARETQQRLDESLHARRGAVHPAQVIAALIIEFARVLLRHAVGERLDLPQRLLQIVRRDVREVLEVAVGALEPRVLLRQLVRMSRHDGLQSPPLAIERPGADQRDGRGGA